MVLRLQMMDYFASIDRRAHDSLFHGEYRSRKNQSATTLQYSKIVPQSNFVLGNMLKNVVVNYNVELFGIICRSSHVLVVSPIAFGMVGRREDLKTGSLKGCYQRGARLKNSNFSVLRVTLCCKFHKREHQAGTIVEATLAQQSLPKVRILPQPTPTDLLNLTGPFSRRAINREFILFG